VTGRTPKSSRPNVTLLDIAADVGVSRATVSLVMQESPLVADTTRANVLESAERLGYVYHRAAASLRSRRSGTIGIVVTTVGNPYFAELTTSVEEDISETGRSVVLGQHLEDLDAQQRLLDRLLEYRVDGIILTPAPATPLRTIRRIQAAGVPLLLTLRRLRGAGTTYVGPDVLAGTRAAVQHLSTHRVPAVVLVGGLENSSTYRERLRGAQAALEDTDVELSALPGPASRETGYLRTRSLLESTQQWPAIFAYNDLVAFGAAAAIRDAGLRVGRDVPLMGFDDIEAARYEQPPLSTVRVGIADVGRVVSQTLSAMIDGNRVADVLTPTQLEIRASCGCPQSRRPRT
jgi:LacI family transcriptional regulator